MTDQIHDSNRSNVTRDAEQAPDGSEAAHSREQPGAETLLTIAETARRITRADVVGVVSFSFANQIVTWRATSGFRGDSPREGAEIAPSLRDSLALCAKNGEIILVEGIGLSEDLPKKDFPVLSGEGVLQAALVPLRARDKRLDALVIGFRTSHRFTEEDQAVLKALAEMSALALDNARLSENLGGAKRIWEQTFDAIRDGIIVHEQNMKIVRCNAHAAEMMNMRPSDAIGMSCADAFTRLFGERAAAYHLGRETGAASSFELQAGDSRRYLVSIAPLGALGNLQGSVITWSDVTELSEMQEQLSRARRLATLGQLAAGVAHEINNPLATITTCAEATLRDVRKEAPAFASESSIEWVFYLEEIVRQALRCKEITRGLLDLSRQRRARYVPCDINSIAAQCARLTSQRIGEGRVEVAIDLDPLIGEVATDAGMVRQVVDNLLCNALDAVIDGGQITVSTMRADERIVIQVADTGCGIAPEVLVRIFDPFFTTKEAGKGAGLGLAISYTLTEALGGALTVESKHGAGSRFRLWIPRRLAETASERRNETQ